MAPVTRSQALKRKSTHYVITDDPKKKLRLSTKVCPKALELLKELGVSSELFKSGKASCTALDSKDPAYKNITAYMSRSPYNVDWTNGLIVFKIKTNLKNSRKEHNDDPNNKGKLRKMLWHGTKHHNVAKILEQGLKVPNKKYDPYFGVGIYFTDQFSYSINYTSPLHNKKTNKFVRYLFLSDVLLGDIFKSYKLVPQAPKWKEKKAEGKGWQTVTVESVQGCSSMTPNPEGDQEIDGCTWPLGALIKDPKAPYENRWSIPANEYVVYEATKAIPEYLVRLEC